MKKSIAEELKSKYWKAETSIDFRDLLYGMAEKFKNENAFRLKDDNGKIYGVTYEKFKNDVVALATILLDMGFAGKKVGLIGKNSYNWSVSYLAISTIGIVVPIDKELSAEDVINFLNVSESLGLMGDSKYIKEVLNKKDILENKETKFIKLENKEKVEGVLNFNNIIKDGEVLLSQGNTAFKDLKINPDELHILLFTSGTTGKAKGVELSQTNILSNITSVYGMFRVYPTDQVLSILPIHHTYECSLGFVMILYCGGCISYCEGLRYINKNIQEFKPTIILCVPLLLENIHRKIEKTIQELFKKIDKSRTDFSFRGLPFWAKPFVRMAVKKSLGGKMRTFIVGAAALNPNLVEEFNAIGIRTLQGYGLTECSPLVAGNNDFYYKADSVGLPIPDVEYKIAEPNEQGIGEIIVKGKNVMLGYYKDPEGTAKAIKDGWFYTGDLGKIDENGYLYITGRCKTVIVTKNGKNIYPEEIEDLLGQHEVVQECMVFGANYENDDETYVTAKVFPNMDYLKEKLQKEELSEQEIKDAVAEVVSSVNSKIPNYKHIKKFYVRDTEFEKTTTKKIKRFGDNLIIR